MDIEKNKKSLPAAHNRWALSQSHAVVNIFVAVSYMFEMNVES